MKEKVEYPLAHGLFGQNFIDQQCGAFGHTSCAATGAKATAFTTEVDQMLGVTGLATYPQEAMLQADEP